MKSRNPGYIGFCLIFVGKLLIGCLPCDIMSEFHQTRFLAKFTTLYLDFKSWYKESHSERGIPKKLDFKENLESKLGKMDPVGWRGHKLKESEKQKIESDNSDSENESPNLKII